MCSIDFVMLCRSPCIVEGTGKSVLEMPSSSMVQWDLDLQSLAPHGYDRRLIKRHILWVTSLQSTILAVGNQMLMLMTPCHDVAGNSAACWDVHATAAFIAGGTPLCRAHPCLPAVLCHPGGHAPVGQAGQAQSGRPQQEAAQDGV